MHNIEVVLVIKKKIHKIKRLSFWRPWELAALLAFALSAHAQGRPCNIAFLISLLHFHSIKISINGNVHHMNKYTLENEYKMSN